MDGIDGRALALVGIGLEQVIDICVILGVAHQPDAFRHAARKKVASQPVAVKQLGACVTHGFQPPQTVSQLRREFLASGFTLASFSRQQQF